MLTAPRPVLHVSTLREPYWRFGQPTNIEVKVDSTGAFRQTDVPIGRYYLCAAPGRGDHLATCSWNRRPIVVEVKERTESAGVAVQLRRGTVVTFRVRDGKSRLPKTDGPRIGVMTASGSYQAAQPVASIGADQEFRLVVPRDETAFLYVADPFRLNDAAGVAVPANRPAVSIPVDSEFEKQIVLTVRPN